MKTTYKKIKFTSGSSIETAIEILNQYKENDVLAMGDFNGHQLYSDIDDIDSAYKKITGKTKAQYDEAQKTRQEQYQEQLRNSIVVMG